MKKPIDHAGELLGNLAGLAARTRAAEEKILEGAQARRAAAVAERDAARPRALIDAKASEGYIALTTEIGHLDRVIASAQRHLAADR
jgi:hypothetical protein